MQEFSELLTQGSNNAWVFIPSAILLGALHGLEPGHSKTMMAAFIIAVRGTVMQAILLGVSAAFSHSAIVWIVVATGIHFEENGRGIVPEPYFQMASGVLLIAVALWMLIKTYRVCSSQSHSKDSLLIHSQGTDLECHTHSLDASETLKHEDAHAKAHALQIERRFSGRKVTTAQIILFGLTGGLIPCPAAITVLLLCLQMQHYVLGLALVLCFSIGLALTMVTAGVIAAVGAKQVNKSWSGLSEFANQAPYFSGVLIIAFGLYLGYQGIVGLSQL